MGDLKGAEWEGILIQLRDGGRFSVEVSPHPNEVVDRDDPLVKQLDLSPERIDELVPELERFGFLERTERGTIRLTRRGLDKADEYRSRDRTAEIERVVDQQTGILLVGLLALYATTIRSLGVSTLATVFVVTVATVVTVVALPFRARRVFREAVPFSGGLASITDLASRRSSWLSPSTGDAGSREPSPDDVAAREREQREDDEPEPEDAE